MLDRLPISINLGGAFLVKLAKEPFHVYEGSLYRFSSELKEIEITVCRGMRTGVERKDLDIDYLVCGAFQKLVELCFHYCRPTDLAVQDRLI